MSFGRLLVATNFPFDMVAIMVYTVGEVIHMQTAKIFTSGRSQAVRLPKECRFSESEVAVKRIGELVVLYPKERADELFYSSLGNFTDDFFESLEAARQEKLPESRRENL
jgi:antitoxin VapB